VEILVVPPSLILILRNLASLRINLKIMYETLKGKTRLKETYGQSHIEINATGKGHFNICGSINLSYSSNTLEFEFEVDQTMIKDFAETLFRDFEQYAN
jgi:hypothetical protein